MFTNCDSFEHFPPAGFAPFVGVCRISPTVGGDRILFQTTLVAWGDNERLFPLSHAERLAQAFPHPTLQVVKNSSTYVMLDCPDETARAIASFVTGRTSAG